MSAYTREQLLELASGYALGALSAEDAAAVEAALPENSELAAEVLSMRETMGVMLRAEAPIAPRASLRAEWLQRVRDGQRQNATLPITRAPEARRQARPSLWYIGSAIAASLTGILILGYQLQRARADLSVATAAAEKRERQLNTVLEADAELQVAMLDGKSELGTGAQFFWNARQQRGMVHAFHLPPAPAGRVYQVWVYRGATPIPVRIFDSGADGHALIEQLTLPNSPAGITSVAITVEPVGGSLQPTTTPILTGEMPRRAKA